MSKGAEVRQGISLDYKEISSLSLLNGSRLREGSGVKSLQAVEKRPSAAFPSSFVIAAYIQVRLTPQDFGCLASGHF